ncbi:MAG: hypothetical protein ACR2RF_25445 [Geminicoccaceae bacterium]
MPDGAGGGGGFLFGGGGGSGTGLSREERALLSEQTELLREARVLATEQSDLFDQLQPFLFQSLGLVRSEEAGRPNPEFERISQQIQQTPPSVVVEEQSFTRAGDFKSQRVNRINPELIRLQNQLQNTSPTLQGALVLDPQLQRLRDVFLTGTEQQFTNFFGQLEQLTPTLNEIESRLAERQLASVRGELPVNPALLGDLGQREADLRESLRRQFGPGFETTTGGIQALQDFEQTRTEQLESARRGDLAQTTGLSALAGGARGTSLQNVLGLNPDQVFSGGPLAAVGATGNPALQSFLGVSQGLNAPLNTLFQSRQLEQQADLFQRQLQAQFMSDLIGAGAAAGIAASSVTKKVDRGPLDDVLERLRHVPVRKWQYKPGEDLDVLDHAGPYAEDMFEQFGVGDGFNLYWVDMVGILLQAVKELDTEVRELKGRLDDGR